ncbi:MAG: hypothetical protein AAFW47_00530 [Pseudomonadota bacterium]
MRRIFVGLAFVAALVLGACDFFISAKATFYQRLTVVVAVDGREVSGSSVQKVRYSREKASLSPQGGGGSTAKGEAVVVDLGQGRYLFAMMSDPQGAFRADMIAAETFKDLLPERGEARFKGENGLWEYQKAWINELAAIRGARRPAHMPLLVTFRDITKPETVTAVDPDNMMAAFPDAPFSSLELKSVALEIIDEAPLTEKVESVLGWLNEYRNFMLDGNRYRTADAENQFSNSLTARFFQSL